MLSRRESIDAGKNPAFDEGHAAPLIQILAWLFLAISSSAVVTQFATKRAMSRRFVGADYVLIIALILSIGQTATTLSPAGQAIGNTQAGIPEEAISRAWEVLYSREILGILTLVTAKGSLLLPLTVMTPNAMHHKMVLATGITTMLWGLSAVLLIAFQCPAPNRWDIQNPECINFRVVRTYNAIMNIVTDLALAVVPTMMVIPLQITPSKRITIIAGFWSRAIVMFATIAYLSYFLMLLFPLDLHSIWRVVVCGQVVQLASFLTSTIPFLEPFVTVWALPRPTPIQVGYGYRYHTLSSHTRI